LELSLLLGDHQRNKVQLQQIVAISVQTLNNLIGKKPTELYWRYNPFQRAKGFLQETFGSLEWVVSPIQSAMAILDRLIVTCHTIHYNRLSLSG
jgi:hypothetical protein